VGTQAMVQPRAVVKREDLVPVCPRGELEQADTKYSAVSSAPTTATSGLDDEWS
jgi:hypothetical protein